MATETKTTPVVLIIGESGTGKSSTFESLPPDKTVILNTELKELPMSNFDDFKNVMCDTYKKLVANIAGLAKADNIEYVVFDSFTSSNEIIQKYAKSQFSGYEIWAEYNEMIVDIIWKLKKLPQQVFITALPEQKTEAFQDPKLYARVKGKELKFGYLEKEMAIVLFTHPVYDDEVGELESVELVYKPNKFNTAKAPKGLFDKRPVNDALFISNAIKKFYGRDTD